MVVFPSTNILLSPLDDKTRDSLEEIKTYLEINGDHYYQNPDNPKRKEFHYFMGNSVVLIKEFGNKADIGIKSSGEISLSLMKNNIEKMLGED